MFSRILRNSTVNISGDVSIVVEMGPRSPLAKLVRKDGKFIIFSPDQLLLLREQAPLITTSLESGVEYDEFQLSKHESVRVTTYRSKKYVNFHRKINTMNGEIYSKYINLQPRQWAEVCKAIPKVGQIFKDINDICSSFHKPVSKERYEQPTSSSQRSKRTSRKRRPTPTREGAPKKKNKV